MARDIDKTLHQNGRVLTRSERSPKFPPSSSTCVSWLSLVKIEGEHDVEDEVKNEVKDEDKVEVKLIQ